MEIFITILLAIFVVFIIFYIKDSRTIKCVPFEHLELYKYLLENAPIDWRKAQQIAEDFDIKPRFVVQMCVRHDIPYKKMERVH